MTALATPRRPASATYAGEFAHQVRRVAQALVQEGVGTGNRIALIASSRLDALVMRCAAEVVGAEPVFCPVNASPERLAEFVIQVGADTVVVFPQTADRAWLAMHSPQVRRVLGYGPVRGADADVSGDATRG